MSLVWTRATQWAETCGDPVRYSVSAAKCGDAYKFQAWRWPAKDGNYQPMQVLLGTFDDAQSARECCEQDSVGVDANGSPVEEYP